MMDVFTGRDYVPFTTAGVVIKPRAGRVAAIVVTTAVTGSLTIYDNPSAAAGPIIYVSPSTPAVGVYPINLPAKFGIYLVPGSAGGGNVVFT